MKTQNKIELSYAHPAPSSEREAEILARVDYLDAKKKIAGHEGDGETLAEVQAELDALCAEWDAGRSVQPTE